MKHAHPRPSAKSGMRPGSLVHLGRPPQHESRIELFDYCGDHFVQIPNCSIDDILKHRETDSVTWVIVEGLAEVDIVEQIGQHFGIHPLVLEDILNTHQRSKFEDYDDYLFIVLKSLWVESEPFSVTHEQVSLLVFEKFVFTFKEKSDDLLAPVIHRLKSTRGRIRNHGSDYLAYAILDGIVDLGFVTIDRLDEAIERLEEVLLKEEPTRKTLNTIQLFKREIVEIRRHFSPTREMLAAILRSDSELISESTLIFFRDVHDHAIRIVESAELYRDILTGLLDIYLSSVSNKMNDIMKVLTMFASIFIPLTFLAGIYGMNFEYMPELKWKWAYPLLWVAFIVIPVLLLRFFRKKGWL